MKVCPKCNSKHGKSGKYCSRKCANSRTWSEDDKKKKAESVRKTFAEKGGHPSRGKPGWKHTEEDKELKRLKSLEDWDKRGRMTPEQIRIKNAEVAARYRARMMSSVPPDADKVLIRLIFKYCPEGYEVDHIIPISKDGTHHQDNLQYLTSHENKKKSNKLNYVTKTAIRWQDIESLKEEYEILKK
jgi:5-methylcytosine-specific restriction endonuclease McrA